ncbi:hypothetical protein BS17DRAFT_371203 [Gyrodon lividus]|nr:hypothetical protein BS17DRAFT_371203 [Gyrodon lividus]
MSHDLETDAFPLLWASPESRFNRFVYAFACYLTVGDSNLRSFYQQASVPGGWEAYHSSYDAASAAMMKVESLVLATSTTLLATSTSATFVDYTNPKVYGALLAAFTTSSAGLVLSLFIRVSKRRPVQNLDDTVSRSRLSLVD